MSRVSWVLVLDAARGIVAGYNTAVTLHQLFYRLVSKQLIPNIQSYYRRLSARTAEARRDGTFPDLADETSEIYQRYWYRSPDEALRETADNYLRDRTEGQPVSIYGRNRRASQLSAGNMDQPSSLSFGRGFQPTLRPSTRCSKRSAPRAVPPLALKPAATRSAPAVIVIASRTFVRSRGGDSFLAGRRVPHRATSTRRATSNWSRP